MNINTFLRSQECEKRVAFDEVLHEDSRYTVMGIATSKLCSSILNKESKEDFLEKIHIFLQNAYLKIPNIYKWQADVNAAADTKKLARFYGWLEESFHIKDCQLITAKQETFILTTPVLEGKVNLIFRDRDNRYHAVIVHPGKSKRTPKGKSIDTLADRELQALVAKYFLEMSYPGITIHSVYLTHESDTANEVAPIFEVSNKKSSNVHSLTYEKLYKEDFFDYGLLYDMIVEVLNQDKKAPDCTSCKHYTLCKTEPVLKSKLQEEAEKEDVVTEQKGEVGFTNEQLKIVRHKDGPLLVFATAGSGKTASLVGRINYLISEGVSPTTILMLAFTNEAASTLLERITPDEGGNMPRICTIHSLGNEILRSYGEAFFGVKHNLLTDMAEKEMLDNLIEAFPNIPGFQYDVKQGKYGLYTTMRSRLKELKENGREMFENIHPKIGEAFYELYDSWRATYEYGNYIGFDDIIPMATRILKECPEILSLYQMMYEYIMVDEYQDVDASQNEFIELLAGNRKNLVVVGDDDQSIYEFRGGSKKFLMEFSQKHNCETVVLKENFRSTDSIVKTAKRVIQNNLERIDKDVVSGTGKVGAAPFLVHSLKVEDMDACIEHFLAQGYSYKDFAILSRTNDRLTEIKSALKAPSALAKTLLRTDSLFLFALSVLELYKAKKEEKTDVGNLLLFFSLFGMRDKALEHFSSRAYEGMNFDIWLDVDPEFHKPVSILNNAIEFLDGCTEPSVFLDYCEMEFGGSLKTNSKKVLSEHLEEQDISTMEQFQSFLSSLYRYESNERVDRETGDAVALITQHDAKGKEWKICFVLAEYSDKTEDTRRLFYVSLTRAKENLVVFVPEKPTSVSFEEELGEMNIF